MTRTILLDAPPLGPVGGDTVITVSAAAEEACQRLHVPHEDSSAIASERELAELQDDYWTEQVRWLGMLEHKLVEASPSLAATGLRPVAASGYLLKLLLDNIFVRAFESDAFAGPGVSEIEYQARAGGPSLLGEVLPLFCAGRSIAFTMTTREGGEARTARPSVARRGVLRLASARDGIGLLAAGRPRRATPGEGALRLLMLSGAYDSAELMRRNAELGGRSLLVIRDRVIDFRRGFPRVVARGPEADAVARHEWQAASSVLRGDPELWAWPESWFGGEVGALVADRVARWIETAMADVVTTATWFSALYDAEQVDAVVTPYLASPAQIGAFAAAQSSPHTQAVLIEHGDIAHAAPSWDLNLLAADAMVVPTHEVADHLEDRRRLYRDTARLVVGSYRWPRYARLKDRRGGIPPVEPAHGFDEAKPTLIYLVTALASDARYLNNAWYPDAWYFGLQAAIVEALATHPRFNVVVKLFPASEHDASPLADHIRRLARPHIMVSRAPFSDWIGIADRVVADMASTGLYEALVAGCPAMGLLWTNHPARPTALAVLGDALQPFSSQSDAAALVDRFAADPAPFMPHLHPEGIDMLDSLRALCGRGPG